MVTQLDQILNVLIPAGAIFFFGFIIFRAFEKDIKRLFEWIGEKMNGPKQKIDPMYEGSINYAR